MRNLHPEIMGFHLVFPLFSLAFLRFPWQNLTKIQILGEIYTFLIILPAEPYCDRPLVRQTELKVPLKEKPVEPANCIFVPVVEPAKLHFPSPITSKNAWGAQNLYKKPSQTFRKDNS